MRRPLLFLSTCLLAVSACGAGETASLEPTLEAAGSGNGVRSARVRAGEGPVALRPFFSAPRGRLGEQSARFVHSLVDSAEDRARLESQGINVDQVVEFCADGSAWFLFTDIVNRGAFEYGQGNAELRFGSGKEPELPQAVLFTVAADELSVRDAWLKVEWLRDLGSGYSFCP
jgi:hypothetical protein